MAAYEPVSRLDWADATYLGYGVHVHQGHDALWLRAERDGQMHLIALEAEELEALARYVTRTWPELGLKGFDYGGGV